MKCSDIEKELLSRIKHHHEMANHPGSGQSGKRKERIRATALSEFLGWLRRNDQKE